MAITRLEATERARADHERTVLERVRQRWQDVSLRQFAAQAGMSYPHLTEVLGGRRRPSRVMLTRLAATLTASAIE